MLVQAIRTLTSLRACRLQVCGNSTWILIQGVVALDKRARQTSTVGRTKEIVGFIPRSVYPGYIAGKIPEKLQGQGRETRSRVRPGMPFGGAEEELTRGGS